MHSRYFLNILCLLSLPGIWLVNEAEARPNFMLIVADDCTWSDLECYGGQAKTPHLNRLVSEGMLFHNCFQSAPMCSPTRHSLYTGLYPVKSGAHPNHTFVKPGTQSLAHSLKNAGYRVALSGKRHINPPESFPFEFSDDRSEKKRERNPNFDTIDLFLEECSKEKTPFSLIVCSTEPHTPYTTGDPSAYDLDNIRLPPHYVDTPETRSQFGKYLAEITYFDSQVGRCLSLLERHGHQEKTLVMVLSEQGNSFPFAKWTCYEAGVRSGMIVRWPGFAKPGTSTTAMVEYVDVVPTFLEAADVVIPKNLDGDSFVSVLKGLKNSHKSYSYSLQTSRGIINGPEHYGIRSVRGERYRFIRNLTPQAMFQNTNFKTEWWESWIRAADKGDQHARQVTQRYSKRPAEELYDCWTDPWNLDNLAANPEFAEVKEDLSRQLAEWMKDQGDLGQRTEMNALERQWSSRKDASPRRSN